MINNLSRVGQTVAPRIRQLQVSQEGQVQLEAPGNPVVVQRQGEEAWRPVSLEDLKACLQKPDDKVTLGLWRDQRRFLIVPPDGQIQNREVQSFSQDQAGGNLISSDVHRRVGHHETDYSIHTARIDASSTFINGDNQLVEPRTIQRSEHTQVTGWGVARRVGHYPSEFSRHTYGA